MALLARERVMIARMRKLIKISTSRARALRCDGDIGSPLALFSNGHAALRRVVGQERHRRSAIATARRRQRLLLYFTHRLARQRNNRPISVSTNAQASRGRVATIACTIAAATERKQISLQKGGAIDADGVEPSILSLKCASSLDVAYYLPMIL